MNNRNTNTNASHDSRSASTKQVLWGCRREAMDLHTQYQPWVLKGNLNISLQQPHHRQNYQFFWQELFLSGWYFTLFVGLMNTFFCRVDKCPRGPMERWYANLFRCASISCTNHRDWLTDWLTDRNWRLAIPHVKQLCHHLSCIPYMWEWYVWPDQTRPYLSQIMKCFFIKLWNVFVLY